MYRVQPVQNKLLQKKWNEKELQLHKTKIRNAKTSIESRPLQQWPPFGVSLSKHSKKEAIQENRFTEIE